MGQKMGKWQPAKQKGRGGVDRSGATAVVSPCLRGTRGNKEALAPLLPPGPSEGSWGGGGSHLAGGWGALSPEDRGCGSVSRGGLPPRPCPGKRRRGAGIARGSPARAPTTMPQSGPGTPRPVFYLQAQSGAGAFPRLGRPGQRRARTRARRAKASGPRRRGSASLCPRPSRMDAGEGGRGPGTEAGLTRPFPLPRPRPAGAPPAARPPPARLGPRRTRDLRGGAVQDPGGACAPRGRPAETRALPSRARCGGSPRTKEVDAACKWWPDDGEALSAWALSFQGPGRSPAS